MHPLAATVLINFYDRQLIVKMAVSLIFCRYHGTSVYTRPELFAILS